MWIDWHEWRAALRSVAPRELPTGTACLLRLVALVFVAEWIVLLALGVDAWRGAFQLDRSWTSRPWSLILNLFAHLPLSLGHIGSNAVGLWLVGPTVERRIGAMRLAALFVICGVAAAFLQVLLFGRPALGASGGVTATIGCALVLTWRSEWSWRLSPVNVLRVLALAVVLDSVSGILSGPSATGDVAHLAGFVLGVFATGIVRPGSRPRAR